MAEFGFVAIDINGSIAPTPPVSATAVPTIAMNSSIMFLFSCFVSSVRSSVTIRMLCLSLALDPVHSAYGMPAHCPNPIALNEASRALHNSTTDMLPGF